MARELSRLCQGVDILTPKWQRKIDHAYQQATETQHHASVVPLLSLALSFLRRVPRPLSLNQHYPACTRGRRRPLYQIEYSICFSQSADQDVLISLSRSPELFRTIPQSIFEIATHRSGSLSTTFFKQVTKV